MQKFKVKLEGVTSYLQHRMDEQKLEAWEKQRGFVVERDDVNKEDAVRAEFHSYRNADGKYFIPSSQIRGALIIAGTYVKGKVGTQTKSMKSTVAAMFYPEEDEIILKPQTYAIRKDSAVNRNVKARIIVIRPEFKNWSCEFTLIVDNDTITKETVEKIIEYAGQYVGIGAWRPTNNGMFGRFKIAQFKPIKAS
ncbi:hypothetical protein GOV13_02710 [Candidatus Pacearchaeota archaeon]|nr:hypothetical protein [Candidatus Pacearchaeota archaeon]